VLQSPEELPQTTLAWDLGRLVMVARSCVTAGYVEPQAAWSLIAGAHAQAAQAFPDWAAFNRSFLVGRAVWGGDDMMLPGLCSIGLGMLQNPESPWRSVSLRG
jgi:hypothetical protein